MDILGCKNDEHLKRNRTTQEVFQTMYKKKVTRGGGVSYAELAFECWLFVLCFCRRSNGCLHVSVSGHIENGVYLSAILLLSLIGIQRLSCEWGIDVFQRVDTKRYAGLVPL